LGVSVSGEEELEAAFGAGRRGPMAGALSTLFGRYRYASFAGAAAVYAAVVLALGERLAVSANYFVLLPIVAAALCFGSPGGLVAGALALPSNLLLFAVLGRPGFSPASKAIAEASGIFFGYVCGRLADNFRSLELEIGRRVATEKALRAALEEKKLLLRELNHRVKNNLSVIKSLAQLQRNRSGDPAFVDAIDELVGRIFAVSLVHDMLDGESSLEMVELDRFVAALVSNIEDGFGLGETSVSLDLEVPGRALQIEAATSLGLIVNEVLTNALKHSARPGEASPDRRRPAISLSLKVERLTSGEQYRLVVADDGPGPGSAPPPQGALGLKLVQSLAENLGGSAKLEAIVPGPAEGGAPSRGAGARFELVFPATFMELI